MRNLLYTSALVGLTLLASCKNDEPAPANAAPYDTTQYLAATTDERALRRRMVLMMAEARRGRNRANTLDAGRLQSLFSAGSPSVATAATPYFAGRIGGPTGWLATMATASGQVYSFEESDTAGTGGVVNNTQYLLDRHGLEVEQLVEKGLFGALLTYRVHQLLDQPITLATPDKVMALLGVSRTFPSSGNATKHARPDSALGSYLAQRDKNDGNGYYSQMRTALRRMQSATRNGDNAAAQTAATDVRTLLDKVTGATVIHYCYQTQSILQGNPTPMDKGSALHKLAEGIGFAHGYRTLPYAGRRLSDAAIDEVLALMGAPASGNPTVYQFVTRSAQTLPRLQQAIARVQQAYGFTDAEVQDFKNDWVGTQTR